MAAIIRAPATHAQTECTAPGATTGYDCVDRIASDWSYTVIAPPNTPLGPFKSEAEAVAAIAAHMIQAGWCTVASTSVTYDDNLAWGATPQYDGGIDIRHGHTIHLQGTAWRESCTYAKDQGFALQQARKLACPNGFDLRYPNGNQALIPYCRRERAAKVNHLKGIGSCPTDASQASGQIWKGNPCELAGGSKVQREVDYARQGAGGLSFVRTYNSLTAQTHYGFGGTASLWEPLGNGWTGTYFQRLHVTPAGGYFGSVFAVRPDGKLLGFNLSGSDYVSDADVADQLSAVRDSGGTLLGWTYRTSHDVTESYDAAGRLQSITPRGGPSIALIYNAYATVPEQAVDAFGRTLTFSYQVIGGVGRLVEVTDPAGLTIQYSYAAGNLTRATHQDGSYRQYGYGLANTLTSLTAESGVLYATWGYAAAGAAFPGYVVTSSQRAGGVEAYTFTYSGANRIVVDPLGTSRTYTTALKEGLRRLTAASSVCTGCESVKALSYDSGGLISSRTDFRNIVTQHAYDTTRKLEVSRTEAYGTAKARTISTTWHSTFRLPDVITQSDRTIDHDYDANGNLTQKTITDTATSATRTWSYAYDSLGRVLTENGPRTDVSDVTTYAYYSCTTGFECGQLETVTNALSQITTYNTYNAHSQPLTITDPNGIVTTLAYDARQRLTSRTTAGETTSIEYWPTDLLKKVTLPDTSFVLYTYDTAHRLFKIEDGEGNRIQYTLDNAGNRTAENVYDPTSVLLRTRTRAFNSLSQLWKEIGAAGTAAVTTTFGYDANGNQTSIAAPLSRNTGQLYDELNRLKQITDPGSGVTQFGYDANDNLTSVTDPRSLVTSYEYNGFGDLTELTSPDTGVATSSYDSAGNLGARTDARSKTGTYAYDGLNRVTSITYPDQTLAFTYDAGTHGKGRLTGASDANHSLAFTFDALGRVTAKGQTVGTITKSVGYGYTDGNLTSLATPSGQTVAYGYSNGRIASVTLNGSITILNQVLYEPFGPVAGWTWGNSTLAARIYDQDGKITDLDSAGASTYGYDDAFRITGVTDLGDSSKSWSHGYDALDRLNSAAKSGQSIGYTYDANGNRLTQSGTQTATYSVSSTSNRVASITGTPARTYTHDAAGNTTGFAGLTFAYSDAGRMASVTSGSATTSYVLNALGQRVKKTGPAGTRLFVYDEAGQLLGEYDGAGALIQETVWLGDIPVATVRPNGSGGVNVFSVHTDHLNTPRRISRPSDNAILWRWDSDPFGTNAANEDPEGDSNSFVYNLRFPGQYFDAESGLHYNYFRDYDPAIGRYVQSDPIGLKGGLNTYLYAMASPVTHEDPRGQNAGVRYGIQGAGIGIGAALACAFNPDLCRTIIKTVCEDIVDFVTRSDAEDECENAEDECFAECEHLLGQGGRTNQGQPYRNCFIGCMKRKGCYKGDMAVE